MTNSPLIVALRDAREYIASYETCVSGDLVLYKIDAALELSSPPDTGGELPMLPPVWREGAPPKPWCDEWFIAILTNGDGRVVLKSIPEEYSYDFRTADESYFSKSRIKKWMQFPDSEFIAPDSADKLSELSASDAPTGTAQIVKELRAIAKLKAREGGDEPSYFAEWKAADLIEGIYCFNPKSTTSAVSAGGG